MSIEDIQALHDLVAEHAIMVREQIEKSAADHNPDMEVEQMKFIVSLT